MFNVISFPISKLPEDNAPTVVVYSGIHTRLVQLGPDYTKEVAAFNSVLITIDRFRSTTFQPAKPFLLVIDS